MGKKFIQRFINVKNRQTAADMDRGSEEIKLTWSVRIPAYRGRGRKIETFPGLACNNCHWGSQQAAAEECWVIKNGEAFQNGMALASRSCGDEDNPPEFGGKCFCYSGSQVRAPKNLICGSRPERTSSLATRSLASKEHASLWAWGRMRVTRTHSRQGRSESFLMASSHTERRVA